MVIHLQRFQTRSPPLKRHGTEIKAGVIIADTEPLVKDALYNFLR